MRDHPDMAERPDWMIVDAVRYAIGRRSYQVGVTADWLCLHWVDLPGNVRAQIIRDIEAEFDRADMMDDIDRQQWERVHALWD